MLYMYIVHVHVAKEVEYNLLVKDYMYYSLLKKIITEWILLTDLTSICHKQLKELMVFVGDQSQSTGWHFF